MWQLVFTIASGDDEGDTAVNYLGTPVYMGPFISSLTTLPKKRTMSYVHGTVGFMCEG